MNITKKHTRLSQHTRDGKKQSGFRYPVRDEHATFFPEKLAKVNEMLKRIIWMPQ